MNTVTRLKKIEGRLLVKNNKELSWGEIVKVLRLICSFEDSKPEDRAKITREEWERYRENQIAGAKSRREGDIWFKPMEKVEEELIRDENRIKRIGGFKD